MSFGEEIHFGNVDNEYQAGNLVDFLLGGGGNDKLAGGGGNDTLRFYDVTAENIRVYRFGTDLIVTSADEVRDFNISAGIIVEDFWYTDTGAIINPETQIEEIRGMYNQLAFDTTLWG